MTKYILHGGSLWESADRDKKLVEELIGEVANEPVKILICYFARPESQWDNLFATQKGQFDAFGLDRKYELLMAQPKDFISQLIWADVLFITGGAESKLRALLEKSPGWEKELNGKTIMGSSAGADLISKYYYNVDTLQIEEGFGLLPLKALVHYRSGYNAPNIDWDAVETELEKYKENLPVIKLAEGQFQVFKV